ncbi:MULTISPECIES: hypothetical protein [Enterobacteriaceae]|uniref:Baculovirus polyhedron envelope protein, PEP, C terminus n=1 Tax=Citrobacter koseri TaxID=545 RepID=A0A2X2WH16_CITKO|nr:MULTISPECIES: hypothetical protein [Enterobacteriaceae]MBJ8865279.1 hypothetical protein [Citrobacter koseri]MBL4565027.1 hypothetical protein [Citrobacter koseri]MDM2947314.1 hypothetical protein [Citrobacter sp. CK207]MDM2980641.1 hypothetical protein [Citrobacter sp. CK197]WOJ09123.1 hypothetical protein R1019_09485 [Citrobacter koseri]
MDSKAKVHTGKVTLSYLEGNNTEPVKLVLPIEADRNTFYTVVKQAVSITEEYSKGRSTECDGINEPTTSSIFIYDIPNTRDRWNEDPIKDDDTSFEVGVENMSAISREELQAHLDKNKAELKEIASDLRCEMEKWSKDNSQKISELTVSINALSSMIEGKSEATNGRLEGMQGQINGMNTSITGISTAISGIQSGLSTKLTVFGVIITVVIALVGFGASLLSSNTSKPISVPQSAQPIIIQVPVPPSASSVQSPGVSVESQDKKSDSKN